ncbi:MAG: ABC transporter permease [Minwuia sp.]|uniref:ABC transporter permease n=1 Tax=Minwuia sp. TaxID=2493630 RepID=UPI003A8BFAD9
MLTAYRLAIRDLRGGLKGFRIFLLSLALGVAAIAGVGSLTSSIVDGLKENGRYILGADVDLRLTHRPASPAERAWLEQNADIVGETLEMRTIVRAVGNDARALAELKAVDNTYPIYGEVVLEGGGALEDAIATGGGTPGAVAEPLLAARLGLEVGDRVKIGEAEFELRGLIEKEPDRATGGAVTLGPRIMVHSDAVGATGLIQVGSLIRWHYKIGLPATEPVDGFRNAMDEALPDAGWRARDRDNGAPGIESFLERLRIFLTLVGLTALLVGGVGVGNAVKAHLDAKRRQIAVLKALGATGNDITKIYLIQILILSLAGIAIGLAIGASVPFVAGGLLADALPAPPSASLYPAVLAMAALFGVLVTLTFALWPLGAARRTRAAELFRAAMAESSGRPGNGFIAGTGLALVGLCGLTLFSSDKPLFALWFILGAAGTFIVLRAAASGVAALARRTGGPKRTAFRMALANLHRPGAPTASVMVSLGLGVTLLAAIAQIEGNVTGQVDQRVSQEAPAFFFVDIQPDQLQPFMATAGAIDGVSDIKTVPALRGRISAVDGVPSRDVKPDPSEAWVLRGDRGLTYADEPPANSPIVAGEWWPKDYDGPPLVSFEDEAAAGLGVGVGDTLTVNVLGRDLTVEIANLRTIDWSTFQINYLMIFSPNALKGAPHTVLATADATDAADPTLFRAVTDEFPNVTVIRVKDAMELFEKLMGQISTAIRSASAVTLAAGLIVLAGAISAGHRRRVRESVILKVIGATRRQVLKIQAFEFALLGATTGVVAAIAGSLAAWAIIEFVMQGDFSVLPVRLAVVVIGAIALTTGFGLYGAHRALKRKPAAELREA